MKNKNLFAVFAAIFIFALFTMNIATSANMEAGSYIIQASKNFNNKNIETTLAILSEGIQNYPNNPQLYLNRGFVEHFLHDYESAMADYNKAIELNPKFAYAYNNRGALKVSLNDIDGAFEDYDKALSINPKYADVYYNKANLEYMMNNYNSALENYDKAIALNPKDSDAYNNRGVVKKRLDYNVGALSDYSQAIALNPNDSIAYANRGRLKKLYFDNEGAAIDLNQAVALAENQVFIKNVKPLLSNQHYIAAIPTASSLTGKSIAINKEDVFSKDNVSQEKIAMYNPKPESEIKNTTKNKTAQKIKEPETKQQNNKNTINAGVGKVVIAEAPDIRTTAVTNNATTNTKLAESYYIRGLQKCILRDLNGAIADLDKAISNNTNYADAYFYRAAIKKELGDNEGFRNDYATAIKIKPSLQTYNDSNALSLAG